MLGIKTESKDGSNCKGRLPLSGLKGEGLLPGLGVPFEEHFDYCGTDLGKNELAVDLPLTVGIGLSIPELQAVPVSVVESILQLSAKHLPGRFDGSGLPFKQPWIKRHATFFSGKACLWLPVCGSRKGICRSVIPKRRIWWWLTVLS